jgi:hypothetical protein
MKLAIYTQYTENYGEADAPYWKNKGGSTYIVENLTQSQVDKVQEHGLPTLTALIEYKNKFSTEYIIGHSVVEDSESACEEWESPIKLAWVNNRWTATRVTENDEFGFLRQEIARKIETWDMMMNGENENRNCTYVLRDGRVVKSSDLELVLI